MKECLGRIQKFQLCDICRHYDLKNDYVNYHWFMIFAADTIFFKIDFSYWSFVLFFNINFNVLKVDIKVSIIEI